MEKRFGVISADGHCRLMHLPFDLWTKRLPRKFQDNGPRVVQRPDGTRQWVVEGRPWSGVGWGGADTRVFQPDILLSDKPSEFVKRQVFFTFEVEDEGGFRRVPEVGLRNFLWASDFPGLDSPWPHSRAMGHAPVEAALGKEALHQLAFENAVRLYKIPVTLPQERALP
jgi:hypothetical protein